LINNQLRGSEKFYISPGGDMLAELQCAYFSLQAP